jgi:hypothetical protein
LDALGGGDDNDAYNSYIEGQEMIVDGFEELGEAAGEVYKDTLLDFSLESTTVEVGLTAIHIEQDLALGLQLGAKAPLKNLKYLKNLVQVLEKSKSFIKGFKSDQTGAICKVILAAEIALRLIL